MLRIINKEIENYIIKILCTTLFIMFTFLIWNNLENTSFASVAKYYENYINLNDNIEYLENYYDSINENYIIKIIIKNNKDFNYKLLLRLNSNHNYDTNNMFIKVNDNISILEDNRYDYTMNNDYYLIDINNSSKNKIYVIEINVSENEKDSYLDYSLEIIEK